MIVISVLLGSEGTAFYLKLMAMVTSSYLDKSMKPIDRVYNSWLPALALRGWLSWITRENFYNLTSHFITINTYLGIEINAHSLINQIEVLKELNLPNLFKPWKTGSQSCEGYFRLARSCSTSGSTCVNFTVKGFLIDCCRKVDASYRLCAQGVIDGIKYPRFKQPFSNDDSNTNEAHQSHGIDTLCIYYIIKFIFPFKFI